MDRGDGRRSRARVRRTSGLSLRDRRRRVGGRRRRCSPPKSVRAPGGGIQREPEQAGAETSGTIWGRGAPSGDGRSRAFRRAGGAGQRVPHGLRRGPRMEVLPGGGPGSGSGRRRVERPEGRLSVSEGLRGARPMAWVYATTSEGRGGGTTPAPGPFPRPRRGQRGTCAAEEHRGRLAVRLSGGTDDRGRRTRP